MTEADAALPFYEKVFGVQTVTVPMGPDYTYTMFQVGDAQVGGNTPPAPAEGEGERDR